MYALRYLGRHQGTDLIQYFEAWCNGPIISEMVRVKGSESVLEELAQKIEEVR